MCVPRGRRRDFEVFPSWFNQVSNRAGNDESELGETTSQRRDFEEFPSDFEEAPAGGQSTVDFQGARLLLRPFWPGSFMPESV